MRLLFAITVCCFLGVLWVALALARRIRLSQLLQARPVRRALAGPVGAYDKQEFFEAGEFRTPRPLRLDQEIFRQKPRRSLSELSFAHEPGPAVAASTSQGLEPADTEETAFEARPARRSEIDTEIKAESAAIFESFSAPDPVKIVDLCEDQHAARSGNLVPINSAAPYASLFGQSVQIARINSQPRTATPQILAPENDSAVSEAVRRVTPVEFALHRRPPMAARVSGLRRRIDLSHYNKDMGDLTDPYTTPLRGSGTQGPVPKNRDDR